MASRLSLWIGGTAAGAALIALAALSGDRTPPPRGAGTVVEGPKARWAQQAARLAAEWSGVEVRRRLARYRDALADAADSARAAGGTSPLLLIDGPATSAQRAELSGWLARFWHEAAPLGFKVAVALVVVRDADARGTPGQPTFQLPPETFLFPDSSHRAMCVAVMHDEYYGRMFFDAARKVPFRAGDALRWITRGLGPCAFYGAYGVPGREMGRWLSGRGFRFALSPEWWTEEPAPTYWIAYLDQPPARQPPGWWVSTYAQVSWSGVACYGGEADRCAADVFDSGAIADSQPSVYRPGMEWRDQPFFDAGQYLSDLARTLGPDRFARFWTADVPVDSAVVLATGKPLSEWTLAWARRNGPHVRLGAAPAPLDVLTGSLAALLALGAALWYAGRRQIS